MFGAPLFLLSFMQSITISYQRLKRFMLKITHLGSKKSRASVDPIFVSEYFSMPRPLSEYCQPHSVSYHSGAGSFASMSSVRFSLPPPSPLPRLSIDTILHDLPYLGPPSFQNKY